MDQLPAASRVLDLGCGGGIDARAMLDRGFVVSAIEAASTIALIAEQRLGQPVQVKRFDQIDAVEEYDAVWASASLIHVPREALSKVLARVFQALKPGGLHFATYKSGVAEGRDTAGRYYNYPSYSELTDFYRLSANWDMLRFTEYTGGGFENGEGPWIAVAARRPS
jgi:SAM-dependent methyltransferase